MPTPSAGAPSTLTATTRYDAFPVGARCANGDRLIAYMTGSSHTIRDPDASLLRSTDGGFTWAAAGTIPESKPSVLTTIEDGATLLFGAWQLDDPGSYSHSRRSTDSGITWGEPVDVPHPWDQQGRVESFVECPNGDVLAFSYGLDAAGTEYSVSQARSRDKARSWIDEGVIFDGDAAGKMYGEPQGIVLDDGTILLMVRSDTGTPTIYSALSTDNGASWSPPVSAFAGTGRPSVYQAPDQTVIVLYRDNAGTRPGRLRASDDRGATWLSAFDFSGSTRKFEYGACIPLPTGQTGLVYATEEIPDADSDLYYVVLDTEPGPVGGRGFWHSTTTGGDEISAHNDLTGRDAADAHPISAITGLTEALAAIDVSPAAVRDAGRWEVVVTGTPAVAVTTEDEADWLYTWIGT